MITPAKGYLLIEARPKKKKSAIYLTEEEEKKRNDYVIVSVGDAESQFKNGQKVIFDVKASDAVVGVKDDDDKEYWLAHEVSVIGTKS